MPEWMMYESLRSILVFAHLLFFALAIYSLIVCDTSVWLGKWSSSGIVSIGKWMKIYLLSLWITGVSLLLADFGIDIASIVGNAKASLKLIIVTVLSINGFFLHKIALPIMASEGKLLLKDARILTTISTISTSHWFLAAFVGCFKPFTHVPIQYLFVSYGFFVIILTCSMVLLVSPKIQTRINQKRAASKLINLGLLESKSDSFSLAGLSIQLNLEKGSSGSQAAFS